MNIRSSLLALPILLACYTSQSFARQSYEIFTPQQYREYYKMFGMFGNEDEYDSYEKSRAKLKQEIESKGYYTPDSDQGISFLIGMKNKKATKAITPDEDPYYSELRQSAAEIPLSFPFSGLTAINSEDILSYAPSDTMQDDGTWTGIVAYFNHMDFGTCRISIADWLTSYSTSLYDQRNVSYEINNKPSTYSIAGSDEFGFSYTVSWTGKRYNKTLECANNNPFNPDTMNQIISLAIIMDEDVADTP